MDGTPTHTEEVTMVRAFVLAVQKARSTVAESVGADEKNPAADQALADLQPWRFGPRGIVPVAAKLLTNAHPCGD
jgi:hypothetical protein